MTEIMRGFCYSIIPFFQQNKKPSETILASRSLCKYKLGDKQGANRDLSRLKEIAERDGYPIGEIHFAEHTDSLQQFIARNFAMDE